MSQKVGSEIKKFTIPNLTLNASHVIGFFGPRGGVQSSLCNETVNIAGIYIVAGIMSNAFPLIVEIIRFKNVYEIIRDARNIVKGKKEEIVKGIISLQRDIKNLEEFIKTIREYDLRTLRDFQNRVKIMNKDLDTLKFQIGKILSRKTFCKVVKLFLSLILAELEFDVSGVIMKVEVLKPPNVMNKISGAVSGMVQFCTAAVMPASAAPSTNGTMTKLHILSDGLTVTTATTIEPSARHAHFISEKDLNNLKSELENIKKFDDARSNVRDFVDREIQMYWHKMD